MKNMIFLIVDSVNYKQLLEKPYKKSSTPFLNKLSKECLTTTHMYAQAPFTEGAVTPLLSGMNLLDRGGYMKRFRYRKTMLQVFQEQGYETFLNHYYSCVYPSHTFLGVDHKYYVNYFDFKQVYGIRFSYYRSLFLNDELSEKEYALVFDIMEDNFKEWIHICEMVLAKDEYVSILLTYGDADGIEHDLNALKKEYEAFQKDPYSYMKTLFLQEQEHILFQLPARLLNRKVDVETQTYVCNTYYPIFKRINAYNRNRNLRNLPFPLGKIAASLCKGNKQDAYQYLAMYKNAVFDADIYDRIEGNYGNFKAAICMRTYIDHALTFLDDRKSEKPFALYLHVDDAHSPENFFSSDSCDKEVLAKEFARIQTYLDELPKSYHGALTSELSLLYVDGCIEYMFEELEKRNLLENTVIAITADHGFSYNYDPLRTTYVNNCYDENYNTPFLLYGKDIKPEKKEGWYMSKDVLPTLLEACDLSIPSEMNGTSILHSQGRDYVMLEYMGGGCPDMLRRELLLGVRDDAYNVVMKIKLQDTFEQGKLSYVFDLKKDAKEQHNLVRKIDRQKIHKELAIIEKRFNEIKKDFEVSDHAFR